jgi:PAS domain S-box-containing protein
VSDTHKKTRLADAQVLSSVIDYLPMPIFVKDENSAFVLSNTQHCELTGLSEDEVLGRTTAVFMDEEGSRTSRERDLPVLETGEESIVRQDYNFSHKQSRYMETRKTRMTDAEGKRYILGVSVDLTEIRQREAHLQALTQSVPVGIVEFGEGEGVLFANDLARSYLSLADDASDFATISLLLGKDRDDFPAANTKFEVTVKQTGGANKRLLVKSTGWINIPFRDNRVAIVSLSDLSEIADLRRENDEVQRLNEQLSQSIAELRRLQDEVIRKGRMEQLGQLTATIAHELRNPLAAVRTTAFVLERKLVAQNPALQPQFARISNGIHRCDDIITQLLDFARTKKVDKKLVKLDDWLAGLLQEECKALSSKVTVSCDLNLDGVEVLADPDRLSRAIINVVNNAAEAMIGKEGALSNPNTINPTIHIHTQQTNRGCEISVTDNGPGMVPEVLARIREPLFTTKNFGTGLGVPAIEKTMEQHGGGMDVVSVVGQGTIFTLWWPSKQESTGQAAA